MSCFYTSSLPKASELRSSTTLEVVQGPNYSALKNNVIVGRNSPQAAREPSVWPSQELNLLSV